MKKKTKITVTAITALAVICAAGTWYLTKPKPELNIATKTENHDTEPNVTVKINENTELPKVYEKITDEETGEQVIAEVQENAPPETKPTAPPGKPKASGSYTNPEAPPTYTKEQTVIEEKPKQKTQTQVSSKQSGSKVYIEGFGYVEQGGSTQTKTGISTGDINKQIGIMD